MSRSTAIDAAFEKMLAADDAKHASGSNEDWSTWQRAATRYWVLRHPDLARFRRGDPATAPTIGEIRERADLLAGARTNIPITWQLAPPSLAKAEHLARVGWFHELYAALYGPIEHAMRHVQSGDATAVETLVRFLEADVYCHRSGYLKADAIRFLTRAGFDGESERRLRDVVLAVVDDFDRREFRSYVRLARRVDDESLRAALRLRAASDHRRTARHAQWVLDGLGERSPSPTETPPSRSAADPR
jgi:hypothetical protein